MKPEKRADGFLTLVHVSEMTRRGQGLPKNSPASIIPKLRCLQIFFRMEEYATYSILGTYARHQAFLSPFDGRNCTLDEIFPSLMRKSPRGKIDLRHHLILSTGSILDDSRLFRTNQFVGYTAPPNLARDERVHKIHDVQKWNKKC